MWCAKPTNSRRPTPSLRASRGFARRSRRRLWRSAPRRPPPPAGLPVRQQPRRRAETGQDRAAGIFRCSMAPLSRAPARPPSTSGDRPRTCGGSNPPAPASLFYCRSWLIWPFRFVLLAHSKIHSAAHSEIRFPRRSRSSPVDERDASNPMRFSTGNELPVALRASWTGV